jgi:hypothetical protein
LVSLQHILEKRYAGLLKNLVLGGILIKDSIVVELIDFVLKI